MKKLMIVAALAAATVSTPAQAATVTIQQTLDLTRAGFSSSGFTGVEGEPGITPVVTFDLAEGDTLDFTMDFLGAQTLTLENATAFWLFAYTDISSDVDGTGTLSLLGADGSPILTSNSFTDVERFVHFGQYFSAADFAGGLPSTITFSGIRYTGTVNDYVDPSVTTRAYSKTAFYFGADANSASAVPEPASWALMIGGLGVAGVRLRRRARRSGAAAIIA